MQDNTSSRAQFVFVNKQVCSRHHKLPRATHTTGRLAPLGKAESCRPIKRNLSRAVSPWGGRVAKGQLAKLFKRYDEMPMHRSHALETFFSK